MSNLFLGNMEMPEKVVQNLKLFTQQCIDDPSLLHDPKLSFIKELIEHYGGKIPGAKTDDTSKHSKCEYESASEEPHWEPEPESEESELELDMSSVTGTFSVCIVHYSCYLLYDE